MFGFMNFTKNTILITGGATGIGFSLAEHFLNTNNEVIICGRRETKLREVKEKLPELHWLEICRLNPIKSSNGGFL
jgi:uncharacterized oxidoreductase